MGVDTKVFVMVDDSEKLKALSILTERVNQFLCTKFKEYCSSVGDLEVFQAVRAYKDEYSTSVDIQTRNMKTFLFVFNVFEESRMLWVNSECDCDYHEVGEEFNTDTTGAKIICSLGHWGHHKEIMQVVVDTLKEFGDTYYIENDCSGDWVKV